MVIALAAVVASVSAQLPAYYGPYQDPYDAAYQGAAYNQPAYTQAYPGYYLGGGQQHQEAYQGLQQQQQLTYPDVQQASYTTAVQQQSSLGVEAQLDGYTAGQVAGGGLHAAVADVDYTSFAPVTPVPIDSQHQVLDEYGQYSFGFTGGDLGRYETRDAYGNVQGSYNYIDSDGKLQTQHYVADELGFRVIGSNLPKGPAVASLSSSSAAVDGTALGETAAVPVVTVPPPAAVTDTPEVAAAKAAFIEAYNKAALAAAEAPDTR